MQPSCLPPIVGLRHAASLFEAAWISCHKSVTDRGESHVPPWVADSRMPILYRINIEKADFNIQTLCNRVFLQTVAVYASATA